MAWQKFIRILAEVIGICNSYYLFNVTNLVDALDHDLVDLKRSKVNGRIMRIRKYAFDIAKIKNEICFKLDEDFVPSDIYITDGLVDSIHKAGLTGFYDKVIWEG